MPKERNRALEQKLIASWRAGETQAALAKRLKAEPSAVSRAIQRLTADGAWSHGGPARGGARPGAGRPMAAPRPPVAAASAPELAGSALHGTLTVRVPGPLFERFRKYCWEQRVPQSRAIATAMDAYLTQQGA